MIIKRYSCQRFAGIRDRSLDFHDGINVLIGDNETGKSTLIEGIYAVMFKALKYDRRSAADRDFYAKFMPLPDGDIIDGQLVLVGQDGQYTVTKTWGSKPSVQLITPKGEKLASEDKIAKALHGILRFGEGTYSNMLFARQANFREALQRMTNNREATQEVSTLLRKAIMELDGVSIDAFGIRLNAEIENIIKRWDVERSCPEKNRGLSNPYVSGVGEVLKAYYEKERLHRDAQDARIMQTKFDDAYSRLEEMERVLAEKRQQKNQMERIEDDVIKRSLLEPRMLQNEKDLVVLAKINQDWPRNEAKLEQLELDLANLEVENGKLEAEKEKVARLSEKEALQKRLDRLEDLNKRRNDLSSDSQGISLVSKEDISALEGFIQVMHTAQAKMQSGVMLGNLIHCNIGGPVTITTDLEPPKILGPVGSFKANGYIRFDSEAISLEIKSGDIDFAQLRSAYDESRTALETTLKRLGVSSIEAAKLHKDKLEAIAVEIRSLDKQIVELLEGETYEDMLIRLNRFGDLEGIRGQAQVEAAFSELTRKRIEVLASKMVLEESIKQWRQEYTNSEGLLEKIIEIKTAIKSDMEELATLAPLPDGYSSAEQFRSDLNQLRRALDDYQTSLHKLKEEYYDAENSLPEISYEELEAEYRQGKRYFGIS